MRRFFFWGGGDRREKVEGKKVHNEESCNYRLKLALQRMFFTVTAIICNRKTDKHKVPKTYFKISI